MVWYNKVMKNLKTTILIVLSFVIGATAVKLHAQVIDYMQVPTTINGYRTFDLLVYLSQLKAKDDASKASQLANPDFGNNKVKAIIGKGLLVLPVK